MVLHTCYFYSIVLLRPLGSFVMITRVICLILLEYVLLLIGGNAQYTLLIFSLQFGGQKVPKAQA